MIEDKFPLCDDHHRRMSRDLSGLFSTDVFKCPSINCGRYYATRYGYFNLVLGAVPAEAAIDPLHRQMKICSEKPHTRSYMAIIRPKNAAPEAKAYWRWHCYECRNPR